MKQSPLWLNRFAELNSSGEFGTVKADYASVIRPGGPDQRGTLSVDKLSLGFGARMVFDLYGEDGNSDLLKVKTLKIERKTGMWVTAGPRYISPVIEVIGHADSDGKMKPGKYVLAEVEKVEGNVDDLIVEGMSTTRKEFYMEDGKLIMEVFALRDATNIAWTGINSSTWNLGDAENFKITEGTEETETYFVADDNVLFNDDAEKKTVTVEGELFPNTITVDNTNAYTFNGTGSIGGNAIFIKQGPGIVTMSGSNTYIGGNHIKEGTVKVSSLANTLDEAGNLGGMTTKASDFTIENGATLHTIAAVTQESPMQMVGEAGGVIHNVQNFDMIKPLSGTILTKKGPGTFFVHSSSSLKRLIIEAGGVAETSNAATVVEIRKGTLYDDCPAYTGSTHEINVPAGAKARWELTGALYTACGNLVTGEGELTVVPRNDKNRVRIVGNWSQFKGTIKHNTAINLPLDCSTGIPHGTLDVAAGSNVTNTGKSFTIGALTGGGTLLEFYTRFDSREAPVGTNTWNVGNSEGRDFTFAGRFTDNGSSCHVAFNKIGSFKMTFTGSGDFQDPCKVEGGELCLNNSKTDIMLGKSTLTVAKGAMLSGKGTLGNTTTTVAVGGTIRSSITEKSVGNLNFSDGNLTINGTIQTYIITKTSFCKYTKIKTLKLNGTLVVRGKEGLALKEGDELKIFDAQTIILGENLQFDLCSPNAELGLTWDTSRIAEGILVVVADPTGINEIVNGKSSNSKYFDLSGRPVATPLHGHLYIVNGKIVKY